MKHFVKTGTLLAAALLVVGCEESQTPVEVPVEVEYPAVAGTYTLTATIREMPGAEFVGTVTLVDESRSTPAFKGTYGVRIISPRGQSNLFTGDVTGSVSTDQKISFTMWDFTNPAAPAHEWTGTLSGPTISGTHLIQARDGSRFSGPFSATKQ